MLSTGQNIRHQPAISCIRCRGVYCADASGQKGRRRARNSQELAQSVWLKAIPGNLRRIRYSWPREF
jgi:hypothetical protein